MEGEGGAIKSLDGQQLVRIKNPEKLDAKNLGVSGKKVKTSLVLPVLVSLFKSANVCGVEQQCRPSRLSPVFFGFFCLLAFLCYHPTNVGYLPKSFQVVLVCTAPMSSR